MFHNYLCTLDIGSSKISCVVATVHKKSVTNMFFESAPAREVQKGAIIDAMSLVEIIGKLLKNVRVKSRIPVKCVSVNVSGQDIVPRESHAIIPLTERGTRLITAHDMRQVNEQARILSANLDEEILHSFPLWYTVDSQKNIVNPLGLYSHRLEVELYLLCARLSYMQSLERILHQAGYEMQSVLFSGVASSSIIFNDAYSKGLVVFCDIGGDSTEIIFFEDGMIRHIECLAKGGNWLTEQLQNGLRISFDLAETVKISYGIVGEGIIVGVDKEILIKKDALYKPLKQHLVSEVLTSATKDFCALLKDTIDGYLKGRVVQQVVVVGRTVLLEGFLEMLENTLSVPVKTGRITSAPFLSLVARQTGLSGQKYLDYIVCLGMIHYLLKEKQKPCLANSPQPFLKRVLNRFQEVYQEYF